MKVLMISGDPRVVVRGGDVYTRLQLQASTVEQLVVFTHGVAKDSVIKDGNLEIHAFGGSKIRAAFKIVTTALKREGYDWITARDPFLLGLLALIIASRLRVKLQLQVHTDISKSRLFALARLLLSRADNVRVVSERLKHMVGPLTPGRISVLPVYIPIERFKTIQHRAQKEKIVLWAGRFEREKDPLRAIAILKEVRDADIAARLIMLGRGSLDDAARSYARQLSVEDYVEFRGWQDPAPFYAKATVVVNTSKYEGFGAVMLEALAARIPVVAPDVGIAAEAGAIVALPDELGQAVIDILRSPQMAGELKMPLYNKEEWAVKWKQALI
jgi:glycosyltransferase involved in cell wall biosynthesis